MNEIGQYIAGGFLGAGALGFLVYRITHHWKRARMASGNRVKWFAVAVSFVFGLLIAFVYPIPDDAPNGNLLLQQSLSIALYGLINGMMISLAALGIKNLTNRPEGQA